jgi:hypothetical protein
MADNPQEKEGGAVPPKVDLRKSGILPGGVPSSEGGEKKPLFTLKPSSEPAATPGVAAKRETSRIPLDAAKPPAGGLEPKTIRIKPAAVPGAIKIGGPEGAEAGASKRSTSRISLESVLGAEAAKAGAAEGGGPKTIRLKRPGEGAKAGEEEAGAAPTIKRTVRVKRTEAPRPTVARVAAEEAIEEFAAPADVVNPVFPVFAILSILVVGVLIYVLMAQAFGPDSSLTQLSYGWRDLDLSWPGKIPIPGR